MMIKQNSRILIIKLSSLGDVVHTLPAVTELKNNIQDCTIDWLVDESFKEIVAAHTNVDKIISIPLRKWKKNLRAKNLFSIIKQVISFIRELRKNQYDYVIDAQGLLKSVVIAKLSRTRKYNKLSKHGYDKASIRGSHISWMYDVKHSVSKQQHATQRVKQLFSQVFNYTKESKLNYGLKKYTQNTDINKPYLVFLHCTTWASKHWPDSYWLELMNKAQAQGYNIVLTSGNQQELDKSNKLIRDYHNKFDKSNNTEIIALPPGDITNIIVLISNSSGVVSVDTGLGHLAAALDKPGVAIYGSTDYKLTGISSSKFTSLFSSLSCSPCLLKHCNKQRDGQDNHNIYPPCYKEISPELVWSNLVQNILE